MPDYVLTASAALDGYDRDFDAVHLREVTGLAIVSIALPLGGEAAAETALSDAFGMSVPAIGTSAIASDGSTRLARPGRDQLFAIFPHAAPDAQNLIAGKLGGAAYTTDQTDVWVALEISGDSARTALERICPIDLHPSAFAEGDTARTAMEHLATLVIRTGAGSFLLLSASSSAASFLHALETSIKNVL